MQQLTVPQSFPSQPVSAAGSKPSSARGSFRDSQRSKKSKAPTLLIEILDTV